jgi:probable F420-dependent oxidoreductase
MTMRGEPHPMAQPFRFGVVASHAPTHAAWVTTARRAEELGYSTLLMPDRANIGGLAPLTALAFAAQATTRLRVGSYVFCNEYRHPVMLAREAVTLDILSEGRFELGLGAGVSSPEFQQLGIPFESGGVRVGRLEEAIQVMKRLFTEDTVDFAGKYYTISQMKGYPKPVQQPRLPLLVAGAGERMLKIAAREADMVAIGMKITERGPDPSDATLEQKLAWMQEAAGERCAALELSQTIYDLVITDSDTPLSSQGGGPPIPKRPMTIAQAVDHLQEQRARYGFSYLQVFGGQMENFAPVVAQLTGK